MLTIIQVIMIFMAFCVIQMVFRLLEKIVETKILIRRQNDLMDTIYSKCVKLIARAIADYRRMGGGGNAKM